MAQKCDILYLFDSRSMTIVDDQQNVNKKFCVAHGGE